MGIFSVTCERVRDGESKVKWEVEVEAGSEIEAREIAKDKASMEFPDYRIAIGSAVQDISNKIDELSIPDALKNKLKIVSTELIGRNIWTATYRKIPSWRMINWWAFFFTWMYYVAKGMWRKGLLILGVGLIITVIGIILAESTGNSYFEDSFTILANIAMCAAAGFGAYPDLYRKLIENKIFWW